MGTAPKSEEQEKPHRRPGDHQHQVPGVEGKVRQDVRHDHRQNQGQHPAGGDPAELVGVVPVHVSSLLLYVHYNRPAVFLQEFGQFLIKT